jgi:hypothetical protein
MCQAFDHEGNLGEPGRERGGLTMVGMPGTHAGSALQTCKRASMTGAIVQAITPATALFKAGISSLLKSSMLRSQLALSSQS